MSFTLHLKENASVKNTTGVTPHVSWWGQVTYVLLSLAAEQVSAAQVPGTPLDTMKIILLVFCYTDSQFET